MVIGTVEFVEADEELDLAPPLNLEDLKVMPLTEKRAMLIFDVNKPGADEVDEADIEVDDGSDFDENAA